MNATGLGWGHSTIYANTEFQHASWVFYPHASPQRQA
jgi:hypothetical protein